MVILKTTNVWLRFDVLRNLFANSSIIFFSVLWGAKLKMFLATGIFYREIYPVNIIVGNSLFKVVISTILA